MGNDQCSASGPRREPSAPGGLCNTEVREPTRAYLTVPCTYGPPAGGGADHRGNARRDARGATRWARRPPGRRPSRLAGVARHQTTGRSSPSGPGGLRAAARMCGAATCPPGRFADAGGNGAVRPSGPLAESGEWPCRGNRHPLPGPSGTSSPPHLRRPPADAACHGWSGHPLVTVLWTGEPIVLEGADLRVAAREPDSRSPGKDLPGHPTRFPLR